MNNLKKMLAVSLAATTAFSTSALATYPDADDITNTDAVELLSTLKILQGDLNGNFNPTSTVTRAEMAKMIYTIKNQGNSVADQFKGIINVFSDTNGHWAEGHINYCYNQGIINGLGNGKFNPEGEVTGLEAMKMCLTALGYTSESAGLTGADWEMNTLTLGLTAGLGADFAGAFAESATRDDAAGMIYNTLYAETVTVTASNIINADGSIGVVYNVTPDGATLATKAMGIQTVTGTVDSSTLAGGLVVDVNTSTDTDNVPTGGKYTFSTDVDYNDFLGQEVVVLVGVKGSKVSVYGMNAATSTKSIKAQYSDLGLSVSGKVTYGGVTIETTLSGDTTANTEYYIYQNDGDTVSVTATLVDVQKVTYVGTDSMTFANVSETTPLTNIDLDDSGYNFEDGLVLNDYVQVVENVFTGVTDVTKLEKQTATVTKFVPSTGIYTIGGVEYSGVTADSLTLGKEYDFLAVGSVIYTIEAVATEAEVANILLITNAGYKPADFDTNVVSKALLTDGTEVTINIGGVYDEDGILQAANLTADDAIVAGQLYGYTVTNDLYNLTLLADSTDYTSTEDLSDYGFTTAQELDAANYSYKNGSVTISAKEYKIASDAVVLNVYFNPDDTSSNFVSHMTGAELLALEEIDLEDVTISVYLAEGTYGEEVTMLIINGSYAEVEETDLKGIVVEQVGQVLDGTTIYYQSIVWDGTENVTVNFANTTAGKTSFEAAGVGGIYSIELDAGIVTEVTDIEADLTTDAVKAYNATEGDLYLNTNSDVIYKVTEDTVIINWDATNEKGVAGSSVSVAGKNPESTEEYLNNVKLIIDSETNEVEFMIVAVNGSFE